jgi:predicted enzyme related to lactoylglutathione lyase
MEKLGGNANALNWFEIPTIDLERARKFYEAIFDAKFFDYEVGGQKMVIFPAPQDKSSGALIQEENCKPSNDGAIIYLNANPSIQAVIDRIEPNGGKVLIPKTLISEEIGYCCHFLDTEGNKVALHAKA